MDANLLHISYEGRILEDPWAAPLESMFRMTKKPSSAKSKGEIIEISFIKGDPVGIRASDEDEEYGLDLVETGTVGQEYVSKK